MFALLVYVVIGTTLGVAAHPIVGRSIAWSVAAGLAGLLGALLGTWIARATSLPFTVEVGGQPFHLASALVGGLLLFGYCISAQVLVSAAPAGTASASAARTSLDVLTVPVRVTSPPRSTVTSIR